MKDVSCDVCHEGNSVLLSGHRLGVEVRGKQWANNTSIGSKEDIDICDDCWKAMKDAAVEISVSRRCPTCNR